MRNLPELKKELLATLPSEGLAFILESLKAILPEGAAKLADLEEIESAYKKWKISSLAGKMTEEEKEAAMDDMEQQASAFIEALEEADFETAEDAEEEEEEDPKLRQGQVMYQIPRKMQYEKETRCIVRISVEEIDILKDLQTEEDTEVREDLSVSDHMRVEIIDPFNGEAFAVRSTSEPVQYIGDDDFTEWRFFVKPLKKEGTHPLEIKVYIIVTVNGRDQVREKTLDETVEIVTEVPIEEEAEALPFRKTDKPFSLNSGNSGFTSSRSPISMGGKKTGSTMGGLAQAALALAFIAGINVFVYVFFPSTQDDYDWVPTVILGDEQSYQDYADKHPESSHKEEALWKAATISDDVDAYHDYLEEYDDEGPHSPEAEEAMDRLAPKTWEDLFSDPNLVDIDRYLRLFPDGHDREGAVDLLQDTANWHPPHREITPRLAKDTVGMLDRLRPLVEPGLPDLFMRDNPPPPAEEDGNDGENGGTALNNTNNNPGVGGNGDSNDPDNTDGTGSSTTPNIGGGNHPVNPNLRDDNTPENNSGEGNGDNSGDSNNNGPAVQDGGQNNNNGGGNGANPDSLGLSDGGGGSGSNNDDNTTQNDPPAPPPISITMPDMARIPGGVFLMGCPEEAVSDCPEDQIGGREVEVPSFYLGRTEVMNFQFAEFLTDQGNRVEGGVRWYEIDGEYAQIEEVGSGQYAAIPGYDYHPVTEVSWYGAKAYAAWLRSKTGRPFRLPSEAEWEYAARGGAYEIEIPYAGSDNANDVAWTSRNSGGQSHEVGLLGENQFGIHDMSGNVYEWCEDNWHPNYQGAPTDSRPWRSGSLDRVYRGGSWFMSPTFARVFKRRAYAPSTRDYRIGFRVAY